MSGVRVPAPPPFRPAAVRLRRLEPILRRALPGACRVRRGERLIVAVSGGADSTALLLVLAALRAELDVSLVAAHLHHGLRGREADGDLEHVRALCRRLDVPLIAARWDTRERMRRRGLSGEAGLRTLRREFLRTAQRSASAHAIATAHTADDQVETVLMRLLRGAGLPGLSGMRPRRGPWIKPLLEAARADVEADLRSAREPWREDSTNFGGQTLRGRIRHDVVPRLIAAAGAEMSLPRLARNVSASVRELDDARRALAARARRLIARAGDPDRAWIARERLARAPRAVQRAALRRLWSAAGARDAGLTRRHLDALIHLVARGGAQSRVGLPAGRFAACRGGRLTIGCAQPAPSTARPVSSGRRAGRTHVRDAKLATTRRARSAARARRAPRAAPTREELR